ncbi:MAG: hypothetical protein IJ629_07445 [Clostridia bacterium]|nr:hypothetical protein [Clostridia bacterium]
MSVKISELDEAESLNDEDLIPVIDTENEKTAKMTFLNFKKSSNVFSDDEEMVGSYMGKPLYRRKIQATMPNTQSDGSMAQSTIILEGDIDINTLDVCKAHYIYTSSSSIKYNREFPYYVIGSGSSRFGAKYSISQTAAQLLEGKIALALQNALSSLNGAMIYMILEYTKTTDSEDVEET